MMKNLKSIPVFFFVLIHCKSAAQERLNDGKALTTIIDKYVKSVIDKDSVTFYSLFNDKNVTWCAAEKERTHEKSIEINGAAKAGSNYWIGTYKGFFRELYKYKLIEDRFDNILIIDDGTVATVTMDYSLWIDNKMHNWGEKYLNLIRKDGVWKITSVIYSYELSEYFVQPSLQERLRNKKRMIQKT